MSLLLLSGHRIQCAHTHSCEVRGQFVCGWVAHRWTRLSLHTEFRKCHRRFGCSSVNDLCSRRCQKSVVQMLVDRDMQNFQVSCVSFPLPLQGTKKWSPCLFCGTMFFFFFFSVSFFLLGLTLGKELVTVQRMG
mgnify:CR=1 FL=1